MVIRNFLFHRVSNETDSMWPPMRPLYFRSVIRYLTEKYNVVSLEEYLDNPQAFATQKKLATVLFDDGYKDNIEYAAPILREFDCPASFYVVTDCINNNIPTWTYRVDHLFQQTRKEKLELGFDFVPENFKQFHLRINHKKTNLASEIKPWMKKLSNNRRLTVMDSLIDQCRDVQTPPGKMMDWDDVRQLHSEGYTIGSHSHTHPMLASLENENEIVDELRTSFNYIKYELGETPATISYPIGSYDKRVTRLAAEAGYKYGLAVRQEFYDDDEDDILEIPRVELYQEPWWKTQLRISGIYSRIKRVWA